MEACLESRREACLESRREAKRRLRNKKRECLRAQMEELESLRKKNEMGHFYQSINRWRNGFQPKRNTGQNRVKTLMRGKRNS